MRYVQATDLKAGDIMYYAYAARWLKIAEVVAGTSRVAVRFSQGGIIVEVAIDEECLIGGEAD